MTRAYSPSMRMASLIIAALVASVALFSVGATSAWAKKAQSLPVAGELSDGGTFEGKIADPVVEEGENGDLSLRGILTGKATTVEGDKKNVKQRFTAPIEATAGAGQAVAPIGAAMAQVPPAGCSIVNLDVGPIDLDVLGLVVNLSPISLDVTAVPGAGNLLGNLLCGVAGLLDNGGLLDLLDDLLTAEFLNDLLDALLRR